MPEVIRFERADGIRGLACLIVLITHAVGMFFVEHSKYIAGTGKMGVWLFFVLSAFLLTYKFQSTGFGIEAISKYFIGRILRILPTFTLAIIVYRLLGTAGIDTWNDAFDCLVFNKGFAHLWTIPVEFKFYLCLPILAFIFNRLKHKWGLKGLYLSFFLLLFLHQWIWPYYLTQINSIEVMQYLPCFGFGMILAFTLKNVELTISENVESLIFILILICLLCMTPGVKHFLFFSPFDTSLSNKFIYIGAIWSAFIACIIKGNGHIATLMQSNLLREIGKYSFSIYLFHWFVYRKLEKISLNNYVAMVVAILSAVLVGALIYKLFESPMENIRHTIMKDFRLPARFNNIRYSRES